MDIILNENATTLEELYGISEERKKEIVKGVATLEPRHLTNPLISFLVSINSLAKTPNEQLFIACLGIKMYSTMNERLGGLLDAVNLMANSR